MGKSLVWFRHDLRLEDNAALEAAVTRGADVIPVFIWAPLEDGAWAPGAASRWWLHHALGDLRSSLRARGSRLVIRDASEGSSEDQLLEIAGVCGADAIYWNSRQEPAALARDRGVMSALLARGIEARSFNSGMLFEPPSINNKAGKPFRVFTPLWRHYQTLEVPPPVKADLDAMLTPAKWPRSDPLSSLGLLPTIPWDAGLAKHWGTPSRAGVLARFEGFVKTQASVYPSTRDFPGEDGTSLLSPALHFGQIGPREAWHALAAAARGAPAIEEGIMRQLVWREFAHHLLHHFPRTPMAPLRPEFELFPWREDPEHLHKWRHGETGYPIVDAGMRQLRQTGWMHNRVRMIAASLLVKHLLGHWLGGARWFWDNLVDADLANNTFGWQWVAGCGADAAPYFRIFNPVAQGERFDPEGRYVKQYLPELEKIPPAFIHKPWEMGELDLDCCGVTLGKNYPHPVITHAEGRSRALAAFKKFGTTPPDDRP